MEPRNTAAPGWYPDPTQRFEFRYYNGERWTADVARFSNRYIDPLDPSTGTFGTTPPPSRGMAVTALVFSLCSLFLAWLPILFVIGAAGALTAIVLAIIVLRRAVPERRGMAIGTIWVSLAAIGLCVVGFQFTRVVLREVDELMNPGSYDVAILNCEHTGERVLAEGSIRNTDDETRTYTISIGFRRDGERWDTRNVRAVDVEPGETSQFSATSSTASASSSELTCTIDNVRGPEPFSD